jgi:hypothetical protein
MDSYHPEIVAVAMFMVSRLVHMSQSDRRRRQSEHSIAKHEGLKKRQKRKSKRKKHHYPEYVDF